VWDFLPTEATRFIMAAVSVPGLACVTGGQAGGDPSREAVGRQLVRLILGLEIGPDLPGGAVLPRVLARLARDPGGRRARDELEHQVSEALEANPALLPRTVAAIEAFYRRRADAGDTAALVELGDFLYWDEPAAARAAYQAAIRAGHARARINLARLLHEVLEDEEAALAAYEQAAAGEDPDLSAEAMYQGALLYTARHEAARAPGVGRRGDGRPGPR